MKNIKIEKKDGNLQDYQPQKIKAAISKSANRVDVELSTEEQNNVVRFVEKQIRLSGLQIIPISLMHVFVEKSLDEVAPEVARSYREYRDYKQDFVQMLDKVYKKSQTIMFLGDKENSNSDSSLVSTKRCLIANQLNKEMYKKFFLTKNEVQMCKDGYIYVHDMSARRDTMNCCIFDMKSVLTGGFEMGNIWYNEPKSLDTAFDVIGDIVLSAASQQYGGFTIPQVDRILEPYAKKSYEMHKEMYRSIVNECGGSYDEEKAHKKAMGAVQREMEQGFQGWEYKFNTVASSRGDYPFITVTIGLATSEFGKMASKTMLNVRKKGEGKKDHKKPVLFPKIVFLYDKKIHGRDCVNYDVFKTGIRCSMTTMYPDWLSLSGDSYVSDIYQKYGKVISPMGCRAFLSPWYEKGGMQPANETDVPIYVGRFNVGAVSLHLPMIYAKAKKENRDFYEVLDYYLEAIRKIHIRTYQYLGEMKASVNPLAYCEGGFYGGHLKYNEKIAPLLKSATASFGITALNELQQLYNGKSIAEDGKFCIEVMKHINDRLAEFSKADGHLYAVYGTPAENLSGLQVEQFVQKYGIIKDVSDRAYMSNSFHCHVTEDISPIEKQDLEKRFWKYFKGGEIQYCKYPLNYNQRAVETLVERAMDMGLYEGINLSLAYCDDCGYEELEMDVCPKCGSRNLTKIERMNGYLSYSRVKGDSRLAKHKMIEISERKSM